MNKSYTGNHHIHRYECAYSIPYFIPQHTEKQANNNKQVIIINI